MNSPFVKQHKKLFMKKKNLKPKKKIGLKKKGSGKKNSDEIYTVKLENNGKSNTCNIKITATDGLEITCDNNVKTMTHIIDSVEISKYNSDVIIYKNGNLYKCKVLKKKDNTYVVTINDHISVKTTFFVNHDINKTYTHENDETNKAPHFVKIQSNETLNNVTVSTENDCVVQDNIGNLNPLVLNKSSNNGDNCCWINSVLYLLLAHEEIFKLFKPSNFTLSINSSKNEVNLEKGKKLEPLLKEFRKGGGNWNNNNYRKIYDFLLYYKDVDKEEVKFGDFGDPNTLIFGIGHYFNITNETRDKQEDIKNKDTLRLIHVDIIDQTHLCDTINRKFSNVDNLSPEKFQNYTCVSFIQSVNAKNLKQQSNYTYVAFHFKTFARINESNWLVMDYGNTTSVDISTVIKPEKGKGYPCYFLFCHNEKLPKKNP